MSPSLVGSEVSTNTLADDREPSAVNTSPSDSEKPFDASAKSDVVLRSSDSVDFFVLKVILSLASPVFDHMFSITPESNEGESTNETKNGLHVVDLAEDSTTLYNLLPLLYPSSYAPDSELTDTLEVYTEVVEAANKYAMDKMLEMLKGLIMNSDTIVEEPVAVFAVGVHFGWVEVMREAAHHSLAIPLRDLVDGDGQSKWLHFMSAADYRDLLSWRFACQDVLDKKFASWTTDKSVPKIRRVFGPHLLKRLNETGCPRSTVLMDNHFVSSTTMGSVYSKYQGYTVKDVENARESMMKNIESALSKVHLKINGIVVQAGD